LIVEGELLIGPVNTVAHEGDTVQLNCSSSLSPTTVAWRFIRRPLTKYVTIFGHSQDGKGIFYEGYGGGKFEIRNQDGQFQNLIIRNVTFADAGTFRCIDQEGFAYQEGASSIGRWGDANLVIVGAYTVQLIVDYVSIITI